MAQGIVTSALVIYGLWDIQTHAHTPTQTQAHTHAHTLIQETKHAASALGLHTCNSLAKLTFINLLSIKVLVMLENPLATGLKKVVTIPLLLVCINRVKKLCKFTHGTTMD